MSIKNVPFSEGKLFEIAGAPGFWKGEPRFVIASGDTSVTKWKSDNLGNVIACKKGCRNPRRQTRPWIAAHMDEIGFIVTHIDRKTGFSEIYTWEDFDPKTLTASAGDRSWKKRIW